MSQHNFVIPAIITGDLIGLLSCGSMLSEFETYEAWVAWVLYMLILDLAVYLVIREESVIRPGPMRQSWLIAIQRRAKHVNWPIWRVLLIEIAFIWAGYSMQLSIASWVMLMVIVNVLVVYWHHTRMIQVVQARDLQQEAFEEAAIRLARLRERRRYSLWNS